MNKYWTAGLAFVALACGAGSSWAQATDNAMDDRLKELRAQSRLLGAMLNELTGNDSRLAHGAFDLVNLSTSEFAHLADLEQLDTLVNEQPGREVLSKQLSYRRYARKSACVFDLNNLQVFAKSAVSPILADQLRKLNFAVDKICKSVKS